MWTDKGPAGWVGGWGEPLMESPLPLIESSLFECGFLKCSRFNADKQVLAFADLLWLIYVSFHQLIFRSALAS